MVLAEDGRLTEVLWDGLAFKNSMAIGHQVMAVNGMAFNGERLKDAIRAAQKTSARIELIVKSGDRYRTISIDYRDGLRYPRLERDAGKPARLDQILTPRK